MSESSEAKTAIERVRTARHPDRPYALDLFKHVFDDFVEIHGDRRYWDDAALICGFARIKGKEVAVIGQQKGRDTNQRRFRNFGMPKPEGYRKALRLMKLAEKFNRPVVSFVDTPGAYPGIDAEERGQAEAIAFNLKEMSRLQVPTVVVILGEGGSGGALAIAVGDRVLMMENAVYSVISPEGCAAILWKDAGESARAAESLKLTAADLKEQGLIDGIIEEAGEWVVADIQSEDPDRELDETTARLVETVAATLDELGNQTNEARLKARLEKFRNMGDWVTG